MRVEAVFCRGGRASGVAHDGLLSRKQEKDGLCMNSETLSVFSLPLTLLSNAAVMPPLCSPPQQGCVKDQRTSGAAGKQTQCSGLYKTNLPVVVSPIPLT